MVRACSGAIAPTPIIQQYSGYPRGSFYFFIPWEEGIDLIIDETQISEIREMNMRFQCNSNEVVV